MIVGIDGGCWTNRRGAGRFVREIAYALARLETPHRFTVFLDPASFADFPLGAPFSPVLVETSEAASDAASPRGKRPIHDVLRMSRAVGREPLDVFFFPSVCSYFPLLKRVPTVLGFHDTIADRNPAFAFANRRQELRWKCKVRMAVHQADTVLTVSEYSKSCLRTLFRIPESRIRVVPEAASPRFRKLDRGLDLGRFLLHVGGMNPNKNLDTLIRAFSRLRARRDGLRLILVGDYKSEGLRGCYAELSALVRALGLEGEVVFAGYVPDPELCALYNGASVFVMPSFDEGFGLPALEAMACGVPVVVSAGNALEEIAGGAAAVVDPRDEGALASIVERILEDEPLRADMSARSLSRAAEFSWDASAAELLRVLAETAGVAQEDALRAA